MITFKKLVNLKREVSFEEITESEILERLKYNF